MSCPCFLPVTDSESTSCSCYLCCYAAMLLCSYAAVLLCRCYLRLELQDCCVRVLLCRPDDPRSAIRVTHLYYFPALVQYQ